MYMMFWTSASDTGKIVDTTLVLITQFEQVFWCGVICTMDHDVGSCKEYDYAVAFVGKACLIKLNGTGMVV